MMKKVFFAAITALVFGACKNEININAEFKEAPIFYGLLNVDSSTHYIKVYKAFLDTETSAIDIAQNPDSIYYSDSIILYVERQSTGQKTYLTKINGEDIGRPMEEGIFANSPNILYTFNQTLNKDDSYTLYFENPRTGKKAKATTRIVNDFQINFPFEGFKFNFTFQSPFDIQWRSAANSRINDVVVRLWFQEWNVNTPDNKVWKNVDWRLANGIVSNGSAGGEQLSVSLDGTSFYNFLQNTIPVDANLRRQAPEECLEIIFSVGGDALYNYIRANQAQSGITSLQTLVEYTNFDGGLGIFSSRKVTKRGGLGLTNPALDSLSCGRFTRELNFVNFNCF